MYSNNIFRHITSSSYLYKVNIVIFFLDTFSRWYMFVNIWSFLADICTLRYICTFFIGPSRNEKSYYISFLRYYREEIQINWNVRYRCIDSTIHICVLVLQSYYFVSCTMRMYMHLTTLDQNNYCTSIMV